MYFTPFKAQSVLILGEYYYIQDITSRVIYSPDERYNFTNLNTYTILDEERPDIVSHKLYDNVNYYWTLFIVNQTSPSDWPLSYTEFNRWINEKYTTTEQNAVHHYEDSDGAWVPTVGWWYFEDSDGTVLNHAYGRGELYDHPEPACVVSGSNGTKVTLYDHLYAENEKKREIKYVRPEHIKSFERDFIQRLEGQIEV